MKTQTYYAIKRSERARQAGNVQAAAPEKSYRDLQAEAKALGVSAAGSREEIEAAIAAAAEAPAPATGEDAE